MCLLAAFKVVFARLSMVVSRASVGCISLRSPMSSRISFPMFIQSAQSKAFLGFVVAVRRAWRLHSEHVARWSDP